eukprot:6102323-Pyramimonas_sp.AAC.1
MAAATGSAKGAAPDPAACFRKACRHGGLSSMSESLYFWIYVSMSRRIARRRLAKVTAHATFCSPRWNSDSFSSATS